MEFAELLSRERDLIENRDGRRRLRNARRFAGREILHENVAGEVGVVIDEIRGAATEDDPVPSGEIAGL